MPTRIEFVRILALPLVLFVATLRADDDDAARKKARMQKHARMFVANPDGSEARPLVRNPGDYFAEGSPDWSQDGSTIAYDAWRPGIDGEFRQGHVFLVDADGRNRRDLGDGALPSLSPRAKRVVYSRYGDKQGVWIANADGTNKTWIDRRGWSARWSPDGTRIAYQIFREGNGGADLVVYDIVEGDQHLVFEGSEHRFEVVYWGFDWSPDSKRIAFKGRLAGEKFVVGIVNASGAADGFRARLNGETGTHVGWRPDGKRLFVSAMFPERNRRQLFSLDPDADDLPDLVTWQDPTLNHQTLVWSPDGERVIFVKRTDPPAVASTESGS